MNRQSFCPLNHLKIIKNENSHNNHFKNSIITINRNSTLNNSKCACEQLNIQHSKLNTQNSTLRTAHNSTLNNSTSAKPTIQNSTFNIASGMVSLHRHKPIQSYLLNHYLILSPSDNHSSRTYDHTLAGGLRHQLYCLSPIR